MDFKMLLFTVMLVSFLAQIQEGQAKFTWPQKDNVVKNRTSARFGYGASRGGLIRDIIKGDVFNVLSSYFFLI